MVEGKIIIYIANYITKNLNLLYPSSASLVLSRYINNHLLLTRMIMIVYLSYMVLFDIIVGSSIVNTVFLLTMHHPKECLLLRFESMFAD